MRSRSEHFNSWQEADALATDAERLLAVELAACARGEGPLPPRFRIEVVDALHGTARARLRVALNAFEPMVGGRAMLRGGY